VSDPREALLREGIAAFNRGDEEAVLAVLDPDVEVFTPPELGNAGTFYGHEGYVAWIESWLEAWEEFRIEPPRAPLPDA
jgi:ketosteroid isomerase-like protein